MSALPNDYVHIHIEQAGAPEVMQLAPLYLSLRQDKCLFVCMRQG